MGNCQPTHSTANHRKEPSTVPSKNGHQILNLNDINLSETSSRRDSKHANIHVVNPDIKIHSVVSAELDYDHETAMTIPLGEVSDEQLLAEVARRRLDLHDKITDTLVKETYDFGKILGHGASGEVVLVTHKTTNQSFACKIVKKNSNMNDAQSMSTEIEIMKRIRHRNVVSMYELYETPKCLWIVLELVDGGDLYHFLANTPQYNEVIASRQFKQILQGVHYLHSLGIVHRDLKLENILLSRAPAGGIGDIKIADFGLSALVRLDEDGYDMEESGKRKRYRSLKDMWGTKEYFAPEVVSQAYGPQADVWALGCVLYEMCTGEQAFPTREHDSESRFYARISRGEYDKSKPVWAKLSNEVKELMNEMLQIDPVNRFSASEALLHGWVTGRSWNEHHSQPLPEVQEAIRARLERRRRRAEARK